METMGIPKKKTNHKFTYKEYSSWPDDERWELINGVAYNMSPAPSRNHQKISRILSTKIDIFLKNKECELYTAPFDVFFPDYIDQDIDDIVTVVQPDLSIICNPVKLIDKGCYGAPDLIIEILSPSTSKKDLNEKFQLYEKHGVKEYWIVDPGNKYIQVFHLQTKGKNSGKYDNGTLVPPANWRENKNTIAESVVLEGFTVDVKELFEKVST